MRSRTAARLPSLPVERSSSTTTLAPCATSCSTTAEPMKPAPPVTRMRIEFLGASGPPVRGSLYWLQAAAGNHGRATPGGRGRLLTADDGTGGTDAGAAGRAGRPDADAVCQRRAAPLPGGLDGPGAGGHGGGFGDAHQPGRRRAGLAFPGRGAHEGRIPPHVHTPRTVRIIRRRGAAHRTLRADAGRAGPAGAAGERAAGGTRSAGAAVLSAHGGLGAGDCGARRGL